MRGKVFYLLAGRTGAMLPPDTDQVVTVLLTRGRPAASPARCTAAAPTTWDALAVLTGVPPDALAGTRLLVDGNGWLRTVKPPGAAPAWNDLVALEKDVQAVREQPLTLAGGGHHHH